MQYMLCAIKHQLYYVESPEYLQALVGIWSQPQNLSPTRSSITFLADHLVQSLHFLETDSLKIEHSRWKRQFTTMLENYQPKTANNTYG